MVPSVAAAIFTRLLPRSTVARNLSGFAATLASFSAPLTPLSTRYLMRSLGREMKADSALEKKPERAKQTRKANKSQLSAASKYYHPLNPLPDQIDHFIIIDFDYKFRLYEVIIALAAEAVKIHITVASYCYRPKPKAKSLRRSLHPSLRRGRSDQGSSPCPRPLQSHGQTSSARPNLHRLLPEPGAGSLNRRSDRRACRST